MAQYQMIEYFDKESDNMQYNIVFSKSFGVELNYATEQEFLENQYFVV